MWLILGVFLLIGFTITCYNTETLTGMYGKEENICKAENCGIDAKLEDEDGRGGHSGAEHRTPKQTDPQTINVERTESEVHHAQTDPQTISLIVTFTNAVANSRLQEKFALTVSSLLKHATVPLAIYVIGDNESQSVASEILRNSGRHAKSTYSMVHLDVNKLASQLEVVVRPMQDHFSYKKGAYYNHALFFLSIAMHKVMPDHMHKVIMIDCDLKFRADIKELYDRFDLFEKDNIMGIGRDMQPVYRHTFWSYRKENPNTRVGEPPPNGLTGFNSGVLLLDLERMRASELYNSLLNRRSVEKLTAEFGFKGHLGDQDFFTLLNMKYEELFHVLPCTWNRQLCTWWKDKGYESVFHQYFTCEGHVNIYHGNCNTPIPDD